VLAYVARRMDRQALLMVLAENSHNQLNHLDGLPEMRLRPLSRNESRALLAANRTRTDRRPRRRTRRGRVAGQPTSPRRGFRRVTAAELAGGSAFRSPTPTDHAHRVTTASTARGIFRPLRASCSWRPPRTRRGRRPSSEASLPGSGPASRQPNCSRRQRLLVLADRVTFAMPWPAVRTYFSATPGERRQTHRELARNTGTTRRGGHGTSAWPRPVTTTRSPMSSNGVPGEHSPAAAPPARAALPGEGRPAHQRPAPAARDRALTAAAAKHDTGDLGAAQRLLAVAEAGPRDPARARPHGLAAGPDRNHRTQRCRVGTTVAGRGPAAAKARARGSPRGLP
jgi:hypothetical protein